MKRIDGRNSLLLLYTSKFDIISSDIVKGPEEE